MESWPSQSPVRAARRAALDELIDRSHLAYRASGRPEPQQHRGRRGRRASADGSISIPGYGRSVPSAKVGQQVALGASREL